MTPLPKKAHRTLKNFSSLLILFKDSQPKSCKPFWSVVLHSQLYSIYMSSESISPAKQLWDLVPCFFGLMLHLHHDFFLFFLLKKQANIRMSKHVLPEERSKILVRKTETYQRAPENFLVTWFYFSLEREKWRRIWTQNVEGPTEVTYLNRWITTF